MGFSYAKMQRYIDIFLVVMTLVVIVQFTYLQGLKSGAKLRKVTCPAFNVSRTHRVHSWVNKWTFLQDYSSDTNKVKVLELSGSCDDIRKSLEFWNKTKNLELHFMCNSLCASPFKPPFRYYGDQTDQYDLRKLVQTGTFDVIVAMGGRSLKEHRVTFEYLFMHGLRFGGSYIVEGVDMDYLPNGCNPTVEYYSRMANMLHSHDSDLSGSLYGSINRIEHDHGMISIRKMSIDVY